MRLAVLTTLLLLGISVRSQSTYAPGNHMENGRLITAVDSNENYVWLGTDEGLFRISRNRRKLKFYSLNVTGLPQNHVTGICCHNDGIVWIGTDHGLVKYDNY